MANVPLWIIVLCWPIAALSQEPATQSHNLATSWMQLITKKAQQEALPPPPSLRLYAYAGITMYECMAMFKPPKTSIYKRSTGQEILREDVRNCNFPIVMNTAMATFSKGIGMFRDTVSIDSLHNAIENDLTRGRDLSMIENSRSIGMTLARQILAWSAQDGNEKPLPAWQPLAGPGKWIMAESVKPSQTGIALLNWKLLLPGLPQAIDPGPPPPYSEQKDAELYKAAAEIVDMRARISKSDSMLTMYWKNNQPTQTNTMGHMQQLLIALIIKENISLEKAIEMFAKHGILMKDLIASCFTIKLKYQHVNVVDYVRNVMKLPQWNTLYFYNFYPSYPANATALVAASAAFMERSFGSNYAFTDSINGKGLQAHRYASFQEMSLEQEKSYLSAGFDYRFSTEAAKSMGRKCEALLQKWME